MTLFSVWPDPGVAWNSRIGKEVPRSKIWRTRRSVHIDDVTDGVDGAFCLLQHYCDDTRAERASGSYNRKAHQHVALQQLAEQSAFGNKICGPENAVSASAPVSPRCARNR